MQVAHNIYVHVPFCVAKCKYCAFFSRACAAPDWKEYETCIINEVKYWGEHVGKVDVPTIFFGGGTPSLMPTNVFARIMDSIRQEFNVVPNAEITIEANPGTIDKNKLIEFCAAGINRLSIGVQSFDDDKLKFLGRIHNSRDACEIIDIALHQNIRVSADFIYGLPHETVDDVIETCTKVNKIGITHCSMYELTIEPNTPFGKMNLDMPTNEEMANMYNAISDTLRLRRYEVSNYCVPGQECRHNQNVWDGEPYIGIGTGAAGRVLLDGIWYEELGAHKMFQPMTDSARATERVITGMRTMRGVKLDTEVRKIIDLEFAKSHSNMLMFLGDTRIAATNDGIMVLDDLIIKLVK